MFVKSSAIWQSKTILARSLARCFYIILSLRCGVPKEAESNRVKYWEAIADNLSEAHYEIIYHHNHYAGVGAHGQCPITAVATPRYLGQRLFFGDEC